MITEFIHNQNWYSNQDWQSLALTQICQVTLLAAAVILIGLCVRNRNPRLMFALCLLLLIKCVVPPVLASRWSVLPDFPLKSSLIESSSTTDLDSSEMWPTANAKPLFEIAIRNDVPIAERDGASSSPMSRPPDDAGEDRVFGSTQSAEPADLLDKESIVSSEKPAESHSLSETSTAVTAVPDVLFPKWTLVEILGVVWLGGCLTFFGVAIWRVTRFRRRMLGGSYSASIEIINRLNELKESLSIRRSVRVWTTDEVRSPIVFGWFRIVIVLPRQLVDPFESDREGLDSVLIHELVHVRRGDLWLGLFQQIVLGLWWFHPAVWWASRQLSLQSEMLCDELTIRQLKCSPAEYARRLLAVLEMETAKQKLESQGSPLALGMSAFGNTRDRLERIMKTKSAKRPVWTWLIFGFTVGAAALVLPGRRPAEADDGKDVTVLPSQSPNNRVTAKPLETFTFQAESGESKTVLMNVQDEPRAWRVDVGAGVRPPLHTMTSAPESVVAKKHQLKQVLTNDPHWASNPVSMRRTIENRIRLGLRAANRGSEVRFGWSGTELYVFASEKQHDDVTQQLDQIKAGKSPEIKVTSLRAVFTPESFRDAIEGTGIDWYLLPDGNAKSANARPPMNDIHLDEIGVNGFGGDAHARDSLKHAAGDLWTGVSQQSEGTWMPLFISFPDEKQSKVWQSQAEQNKRTNLLHWPSLTLFDGQTARIEDQSQRPFVTSLRSSEDGALQPEITILEDGDSVAVTSHIVSPDVIVLNLSWNVSTVNDVRTWSFPGKTPPGNEDKATVQRPKSTVSRVSTQLEVHPDSKILIAWAARSRFGEAVVHAMMLQASIESDGGVFEGQTFTSPVLPSDSVKQARKRGLVSLTDFPDLDSLYEENSKINQEYRKENWTPITMPRSVQKVLDDLDVKFVARDLQSMQIKDQMCEINAAEIRLLSQPVGNRRQETDPLFKMRSGTMSVQGENDHVVMRAKDVQQCEHNHMGRFSADEFVFEMNGKESIMKVQLNGNVSFEFQDGSTGTCDRIAHLGEKVLFSGNVRLEMKSESGKVHSIEAKNVTIDGDFPMMIVEK